MALDFQNPSIAFGQGLDTKTDSKQVVQGKLLTLRDGIFTKQKRLSKRNGYDVLPLDLFTGSTFSSPVMTTSLDSVLVAASSAGSLYSFSDNANKWRNSGKYDSIKTTILNVAGPIATTTGYNLPSCLNTQSVVTGNYAVVAFEQMTTRSAPPTITGYVYVVDLLTNTIIGSVSNTSGYAQQRLAAFSDGTVALLSVERSTSDLYIQKVNINTGSAAVTLTNATALETVMQAYGAATANYFSYDVCQNGTNLTVVSSLSSAGNPISLKTVDTSFSTVASATMAAAGFAMPLNIRGDTSNIWLFWAVGAAAATMPGAAEDVYYAVRAKSNLASVKAATAVTTGLDFVRQIAIEPISSTSMKAWIGTTTVTAGISQIDMTTSVTAAWLVDYVSGSPSNTSNIYHVVPFANVFTKGSKNYLPVVYPSSEQFSGMLIDTSDSHVAGKFLFNSAESANGSEATSVPTVGGYSWRFAGYLSSCSAYGSDKIIFGSGKVVETRINDQNGLNLYQMLSCLVTFEWDSDDAYQAIESNGVVILNGSQVSQFDGVAVSELNFNYYPEINLTQGTAGTLPDGTYLIQCAYKWLDAKGNLHLSAPSNAISVTLSGGGNGSFVVTAKKYDTTTRLNTEIILYISLDGGTIPYFFTSTSGQGNLETFTVTSGAAFNVLETEPLYTQGGAVLANSAPPPSMVMWLSNNRLFMLDSENPKTDIWYTKTFSKLTGISPSAELVDVIDSRLGNVVDGIAMDEKQIFIKQQGIMYQIGDGANDAGQGISFSLPQIIPSDVGGYSSRGTILYPEGVIFKASNNKGLYRVSRGLQVEYFGFPVEEFNAQDITDAQIVGDRSQIRFLTSSGYSLVYDYIFNQWSTFSNHTGYSATIWNGVYTYVRTDGSIYAENSTTFLDNATAFSLYAKTAWFKAASTQNFQRVKSIETLGNFTGSSSHGLQISVAYDFSSTTSDLDPIYFAGSDGPYQYQASLTQQKCDAFQLIFNELTSGASGEFIDLTDLGIEIGLKKGLNKLPASQSVG